MATSFANLLPQPRVLEAHTGGTAYRGRLRVTTERLTPETAAVFSQLLPLLFGDTLAAEAPDALEVTVRLVPRHAPRELTDVAAPLRREAYELRVGRRMQLTAATLAGLQRGIQTVKQLLEDAESAGRVPACRIVDWPRLTMRGIHYDLAREMEYRHEHLKSIVARLAYFKMNTLHLYLEGQFAYPSAPEVTPAGAMTPQDARELTAYARLFGITIIPQIPTMGHMDKLLHGPYAVLREDPATAYNLCPTHPGARPFVAELIKDVAEAFQPPFIHLGYDESHSGVCARCREHGTPQDLLAEHLNWMNGEVKKHHARAMIYGDKFLARQDFPQADAVNGGTPAEAREALSRIGRDILITDWHYTAPYAGTVQHLVSQGFEVHMATATNIYWHDSIPLSRGHHWIAETIDNAVAAGATGAFNCNWELYRGAFFENYWFFEGLAAERQWTDRPHDFVSFGPRFAARFWGVDRDYYSDIAALLESTPTARRRIFVDSSVMADAGMGQAQFDYLGIADYLERQIALFRQAARRNADTLSMLDMPALIVRYLGTRLLNLARMRNALGADDRQAAAAAVSGIRDVALRVDAKLAEGFRVYGGAGVDRERLGKQIAELDALLSSGDIRDWAPLQSFAASPLQPPPADIAVLAPPPAELSFAAIPGVPNTDMADVRDVHGGQDGLVYVQAVAQLPHALAGRLLYGADGPVKVWVNGEPVGGVPDATNPCTPDEYSCKVNWKKGENTVVFALLTNHGKAWGVCGRTAPDA